MKTIYKEALKLMQPNEISFWRSDLYLKRNEISVKLVANYEYKNSVEMFINQVDGQIWFDIPFAYDVFWEKGNVKSQLNSNMK